MCEPPPSSVHAVYKSRGLSQGAQAPGGRHSLLWSLGGWGGKYGVWGARPRRTQLLYLGGGMEEQWERGARVAFSLQNTPSLRGTRRRGRTS